MFEVVTGKKSKGSVDKLEGLTKMYTDINEEIAIIKIPVELMEVDSRYQTDERTERDLQYLVRNWDERKLMPLMGVPHWEEGKVYIVDGYGRWIASQIVNKKKYKDLKVQMILNAPTNPEERLEFEAEMYAFQNRDVKDLTPIQKHGAMMVLHDPSTETLENMRKKYGFEYVASKGNREASVLGSYTETYIMRSLRDIYKLYANDREATKEFLIEELRQITPVGLKAKATVKYPMLDMKTAVSLYTEDMVVKNLGLEQSREVSGTRVVPIKRTKTA